MPRNGRVSELSGALRRTLEDAYGHVRVRAELGAVKVHSSGHVYLDLKDDKACLAGVIWRMSAARMRFKPEMGMEVIATGKITTYPGQSKYQLIVETLEPAGRRSAAGATRGAQAASGGGGLVRPRAQAAPALSA